MKDEFSVNELEPERNTSEVVEETTQVQYTEGSDAAYLNQEAKTIDEKKIDETTEEFVEEEYQGPTIKEVLVNSVNPDYQGPTAKEIVVNSVKVDKTKKRNMVGLFVLILVLVLIGIIVVFEVLSEDKTKNANNTNYLEGLPKWVETYNKYLKEEYDGVVAYNIVFLDFDFDNNVEAIVNYVKDSKTVYDLIDISSGIYVKDLEVTDIFLMYSFINEDVIWFVNTSNSDIDMNLIDLAKRFGGNTEYETNLNSDNLSEFKSNHLSLSYSLKYTKISFRTMEQNLAEAVKVYEDENVKVKDMVNRTIDTYSEGE